MWSDLFGAAFFAKDLAWLGGVLPLMALSKRAQQTGCILLFDQGKAGELRASCCSGCSKGNESEESPKDLCLCSC